jgi:3-oxoacyl-[acyl-carrier protein] reductase
MATAEEVRALGRRAVAVRTDVGVRGEVEEMVQKTVEEFGRIDILVNVAWNVWFTTEALSDLMTPEITDATVETFRGILNCFRAVLPHMRGQKYGRIVSITSVGSKSKVPNCPVYGGLKAGVAHFSRCVADVVGPEGITVNCVAPGVMKSASTFDIYPKQILDVVKSRLAAQRLGDEEEVARAVLFLADDESGWINGVHFSVDGGQAPF